MANLHEKEISYHAESQERLDRLHKVVKEVVEARGEYHPPLRKSRPPREKLNLAYVAFSIGGGLVLATVIIGSLPVTYGEGRKTENPLQIISPYPPHNRIDISKNPQTGEPFKRGDLAKDPRNGRIFRIP